MPFVQSRLVGRSGRLAALASRRARPPAVCSEKGDWLGALITPWLMSLFLLPGGGNLWSDRRLGERSYITFPIGPLEFIANYEADAELPRHLSSVRCSLQRDSSPRSTPPAPRWQRCYLPRIKPTRWRSKASRGGTNRFFAAGPCCGVSPSLASADCAPPDGSPRRRVGRTVRGKLSPSDAHSTHGRCWRRTLAHSRCPLGNVQKQPAKFMFHKGIFQNFNKGTLSLTELLPRQGGGWERDGAKGRISLQCIVTPSPSRPVQSQTSLARPSP